MRLVLLAALLAGCFGSPPEVHVAIDNRTGESQAFEVVAWWDDDDHVQRGRATGTIAAGAHERLFTFHAPCDEGRLVFVGALANGTSVVFEQDWGQGCSGQTMTFVLEPPRARFLAG